MVEATLPESTLTEALTLQDHVSEGVKENCFMIEDSAHFLISPLEDTVPTEMRLETSEQNIIAEQMASMTHSQDFFTFK
jgi:hypothetical protein